MTAADRPSVTDNARAEAWDEGYEAGRTDAEFPPATLKNPYRAAGRAETTTATTEDAAILARECDLADAKMRKWVRVPVKRVRGLLATARTRPTELPRGVIDDTPARGTNVSADDF